MIIIVCGQDRCGKTTLIKGLRKLITNSKILVIHSGTPPKNVDVKLWSYLYYDNLLSKTVILSEEEDYQIILDRAHLGETVYSPLFRNTTADYIWDIERNRLMNRNVALVVLTDNPSNVIERDDGLGHEQNLDDIAKVKSGFENAYNKSIIENKLLWNITDDGWPDAYDIMRRLNLQCLK